MLKSLATAVIASIVVITVLDLLSVPVAPLLASAGIVGVALGFGAQSLVKDVISGVFMLAEDQYGVGDVVDLGDASGMVEAVGLRVTRLRDVNGTVWYVRNGEVLRVGNQSQGWARAVLDIPVALRRGPHPCPGPAAGRRPRAEGGRRLPATWSSTTPRSGASKTSAPTAS